MHSLMTKKQSGLNYMFEADREEEMCGMSISLPVHTVCAVCAVPVIENQAYRFGIRFVRKYYMDY